MMRTGNICRVESCDPATPHLETGWLQWPRLKMFGDITCFSEKRCEMSTIGFVTERVPKSQWALDLRDLCRFSGTVTSAFREIPSGRAW